MNTQLGSMNASINKYLTPDVILKYFETSNDRQLDTTSGSSDTTISEKRKTIRKAFKALQNMNSVIKNNPFYKDKISYPIYIQHDTKDGDSDYDFLLLTNDLIHKEILQEINYDDTVTLIFLFLKDQLYPTETLPEIGTKGEDGNIRTNIAQFIEFSKKNNTDPISVMLKLIKIAGARKEQHKPYNGLISFAKTNKALNNSISKSFFKLFGGDRKTGQIKDIQFLLNEINHLSMDKFFNDGHQNVDKAKTPEGQADYIHNRHQTVSSRNETAPSSKTERMYLSAKVNEYNKILSMVDSLIVFNKEKDIIKDVENSISDNTVQVMMKGESKEIDINYDELIPAVRNNYFEALIINFIQKVNNIMMTVARQLDFIDSSSGRQNSLSSSNHANTKQDSIEFLELERATLSKEATDASFELQQPGISKVDYDTRKIKYDTAYKKLMDMDDRIRKAEQLDQYNYATKGYNNENASIANDIKSDLKYNISNVKNELTSILKDVEAMIYNKDALQLIMDNFAKTTDRSSQDELIANFLNKNTYTTSLKLHIQQLAIEVVDSMKDQFIEVELNYFDENDNKREATLEKAFDNIMARELETKITTILNKEVLTLFNRIAQNFGNGVLYEAQKYADLRTENNPIIRKTVGKANNFKSYILKDDLLIALYDILHHVDNQKFIAGLIAYPPSGISNDLNKIKYVINRLGLDNNPVFVIGHSNVILSSPDFLSMTGTPITSKISFSKMFEICNINYDGELYSAKNILRVDPNVKLEEIQKQYKDELQQIEIDIAAAKIQIARNPNSGLHKGILSGYESALEKSLRNYKNEIDKLKKRKPGSSYNEYATSDHTQPFDDKVTDAHNLENDYKYLLPKNNKNSGGKCGKNNSGKLKNGRCIKNINGTDHVWTKKGDGGKV